MKNRFDLIRMTMQEMKTYLILWATQAFSGLGSAMTSYALSFGPIPRRAVRW